MSREPWLSRDRDPSTTAADSERVTDPQRPDMDFDKIVRWCVWDGDFPRLFYYLYEHKDYIECLEARIRELEDLAEHRLRVMTRLANAERDVARYQARLAELEARCPCLYVNTQAEVTKQNEARIAELECENAGCNAENIRLHERIAELDQCIVDMGASLIDQSERIAELEARIAELEVEMSRREGIFHRVVGERAELRARITELELSISNHLQIIAELKARLADLKVECPCLDVGMQNGIIERQEDRIEELEALKTPNLCAGCEYTRATCPATNEDVAAGPLCRAGKPRNDDCCELEVA